MWQYLGLLLLLLPVTKEYCKTFCPMSRIRPVTGAPTINIQSTLRTATDLYKMFRFQYYLVATVTHTQSVRCQVCVYIHIFFTLQRSYFMFMVPCIIIYSMNNQQIQLYAVNFIPLLRSLYMFRVFYTPIIRSTILKTVSTATGTDHNIISATYSQRGLQASILRLWFRAS